MFISKMMSVKKTLLVVVAFGCLIEQSVVAVRTRSCDITLRSGKKVMHAPTVKERVKREQADQRHGQAAQALAQVQVASMATPMVVAEADDDGAGAAQAVVCDACARDGHPLHCAAQTGHDDCVRALLLHGAAVDARNSDGWTPLHCEAGYAYLNCKTGEILSDDDVNAQDVFGITPLHCAAKTGHADCVRVLLLHGAAIGARDSGGWTPLHWATWNGDVECVQVLLTAGADVNARDSDGLTPLHQAAENGHLDCVNLLLATPNVDVNNVDNVIDVSPLYWAVENSYAAIVEALLKAGADVNARGRDGDGRTPLHWAAWLGHVECVQVLLTAGADWRLTDIEDQTAADVACVCYHGADRDQRIKQIRDLIRSAPARTSLQVLCALAAARHQVQLQENEVMPQAIKDFLKQLGWYDGQTGGGAGSSSK